MTSLKVTSYGEHVYSVPGLLTDISPAEGLHQAMDSLQALEQTIAHVFNRIQTRVTEERSKISNIVQRVSNAQAKVQQIGANPQRVTTIFSTAKYPAPKVLPDVKRVSTEDLTVDSLPPNDMDAQGGLFLETRKTMHKIPLTERFQPAPPAQISVLFTALSQAHLNSMEHKSDEPQEGLGRLPSYLPSISSVLLFNSDENPYKQYVTINNLEGVGGQDRQQQDSGPSAAPKSLVEGADLPTFAGFQFEYKPLLGELPTFDLPQNLPLGRLADISFGMDSTMSIAPSLATLSLPSLDMLALPIPTRPAQQSAVPSNQALLPAGTSSSTTTSTAPTLTSTPSTTVSAPVTVPTAPPPPSVPIAPPVTSTAAPPPPPGPPAPTAPPAAAAKAPASNNGRSALLESIRNGNNLKKLRRVDDEGGSKKESGKGAAKAAAKKTGEKPPPSDGGGDMMSALRERLARRHNAISGKAQDEPVKAADASKPPAPQRRLSIAPRRPGAGAPAPAANNKAKPSVDDEAAEDDADEDNGDAPKSNKMPDAVMAAYMAAHAQKQAGDDDWE